MIARPFPLGKGGGVGAGLSALRRPGKFKSHDGNVWFALQKIVPLSGKIEKKIERLWWRKRCQPAQESLASKLEPGCAFLFP